MKNHIYIPALLALIFLAGGCALPPVQGYPPRTQQKKQSEVSPVPEKIVPKVNLTTPGKSAPQIPKEDPPKAVDQTLQAKAPTPAKEAPPQPTQPALTQKTKIFKDNATGLTFTYERPWHLVSNHEKGPVLGRDGRSQLTARFVTLTTDRNRGEQEGYFYVPADSLSGKIGKTLKTILGVEDNLATKGKIPLDVLLTQKHFPDLIIEKRYRGNDGKVLVQRCRHRKLPGQVQVYHVFIGDKVASYSLSELKNRKLKLEMQQIVFSTRKP